MKTFVQQILDGNAAPDMIDDWVSAWHQSDSEVELHDSIGFTLGEYKEWVANPNSLANILEKRGYDGSKRAIQKDGLTIAHGIDEQEQEASYMNATLSIGENYALTVGLIPPDEVIEMDEDAFNLRIDKDFASLLAAGWSVEIQRGRSAENRDAHVDRFVEIINED